MKTKMLCFTLGLAMLPVVLLGAAHAQEKMAPDALVKSVVNKALTAVRADKSIGGGRSEATEDYVRENIITHVDTRRVTALAMGKSWRDASDAQKESISKEFSNLLIRTYSGALVLYKNYDMSFKPLRMNDGDKDVTVQTVAAQPGKPTVGIDYRLIDSGSDWKIYDMAVGGVSLVTSYRTMFANLVRDKGLDGVAAALKEKSKEVSSKANAL